MDTRGLLTKSTLILLFLLLGPRVALAGPSSYPYSTMTAGLTNNVFAYRIQNTTTSTVYFLFWVPKGSTYVSLWVPTVDDTTASAVTHVNSNRPMSIIRGSYIYNVGTWDNSQWGYRSNLWLFFCVYSPSTAWSPYTYVWGKNVYGSGWYQVPIRTATSYIGQEYSYMSQASNVPSVFVNAPISRTIAEGGLTLVVDWQLLGVAVNAGQTAMIYIPVWDRGKSYYDLKEAVIKAEKVYDTYGNPSLNIVRNLRGYPYERDYNTKVLFEPWPIYQWSTTTITVSVFQNGKQVKKITPTRLDYSEALVSGSDVLPQVEQPNDYTIELVDDPTTWTVTTTTEMPRSPSAFWTYLTGLFSIFDRIVSALDALLRYGGGNS